MIDVFINNVCYCCLNDNCSKKVAISKEKNCTTYKCNEYIKNKNETHINFNSNMIQAVLSLIKETRRITCRAICHVKYDMARCNL